MYMELYKKRAVPCTQIMELERTPELLVPVATVSADRLTDEATGEPYFSVRVRAGADEMKKLDGLTLTPGMPAETFVNTGERTVLSQIVKPFTDGMTRSFRE